MPNALLIYNPFAGRFPPATAAKKAAETLERKGWTVEVQETRDADHVETLARQAVDDRLDALIVSGGDGSIRRAIYGLKKSNTALGILPTGTANVLARQLGFPKIQPNNLNSVIDNANLIAQSRARRMDIGVCNGSPFLLWSGIGFDAMIVSQAELKRTRLRKNLVVPEYFIRTVWSAHRWPGLHYDMDITRANGKKTNVKEKAQICVVTNIPLYAGGHATLAPGTIIDDGEMEIWLFKGMGSRSALRHAWNLWQGNHVKDNRVVRFPFAELHLKTNKTTHIHSDGDPINTFAEFQINVEHKALNILTPPTMQKTLFSS